MVDGIRRWLSSGRIQSETGAFCAWRDATTGELAFEYPEITGYALSWLAARDAPGEHEINSASRAADWLISRFAAGDWSARGGWESGAIYTFDLAMVAAGLISFGRLVGEQTYIEHGVGVAKTLVTYLERCGELPALAPDGPVSPRSGEWSTQGRVHLVKCVQALLLADERQAAERIVDQALGEQAPDGHFRTQPDDGFVMLHPHLYAVEGLWMLAEAGGDSTARSAARRATKWVWEHQLPSGGLPRWVTASEAGPEQLDATSQAIRAAILLELEPGGLERAVRRLTRAGEVRCRLWVRFDLSTGGRRRPSQRVGHNVRGSGAGAGY